MLTLKRHIWHYAIKEAKNIDKTWINSVSRPENEMVVKCLSFGWLLLDTLQVIRACNHFIFWPLIGLFFYWDQKWLLTTSANLSMHEWKKWTKIHLILDFWVVFMIFYQIAKVVVCTNLLSFNRSTSSRLYSFKR